MGFLAVEVVYHEANTLHNAWIYDQGMLGMSVSSILRLVGCTMGLQIFQEHTMLMGSVEHLKKYMSL